MTTPTSPNPYEYDDAPSVASPADDWKPDPSWQPTRYFLANYGGVPTAAARWYWPTATLTETWDTKTQSWVTHDLFNRLNDDPTWEDSTKDDVDKWIAGQNA